jgi:hypothetical protein
MTEINITDRQLKLNPFDLADCDLVFGPVVEFRGAGRLMRSHLLGMLELFGQKETMPGKPGQ